MLLKFLLLGRFRCLRGGRDARGDGRHPGLHCDIRQANVGRRRRGAATADNQRPECWTRRASATVGMAGELKALEQEYSAACIERDELVAETGRFSELPAAQIRCLQLLQRIQKLRRAQRRSEVPDQAALQPCRESRASPGTVPAFSRR